MASIGQDSPLPHQPTPQPPSSASSPISANPSKKSRHKKPIEKTKQSDSPPSLPYPPRAPAHYVPPYHYPLMNPHYPQPYPQQHYPPPQSSNRPDVPPNPPPHYAYPVQYPHHYSYQYPPPQPMSASPPAHGNKRKRKSTVDGRDKASDDETGPSGSDAGRAAVAAEMKKRTKTQRACDSCRTRKIRCDIIVDSDPPTCQHCKQYGFDCTFFLPITETRFKKKKMEDEADKEKAPEPARPVASPALVESQASVFGPTSPAHLLHSQGSIPARMYETYDQRYHHTFEISQSGDGLITVKKPVADEQTSTHPKPVDLRIERDVLEQLINAYFTDVAPVLPVVTQAEFLANPNPPPILLYSMCLVAAARREVPQAIFDSIRYTVNSVLKADDVLSTASIVNVQALLILCMTGDTHSQFVSNALSGLWIRLGTAIRMAQDLGLHRAESVKQNIELRRRLWGACLISDRWTSLAYGHPYMIDVQDCDARLPSSGDHNDLYMDELVRISVILGRVLKSIYSPSGLAFTTDEVLTSLLADMESWKAGLPEHLKFRGPKTSRNAGLLHLLYSCVCMMFWRVFMRISYTCPAHLKFGLTVEEWSKLVTLTGESIDWLEANERIYDVWLLVAYAATSCALVQYHTWARRKDEDAAAKLRKLRDCVRRWEGSISPDHMSVRRKTAEIISLLYEATQGPPPPMETPALNPTGGVKPKPPVGLDYKKDPTRPGGGVFVAHGKVARQGDFSGVPSGVVISSNSSDADSDTGEAAPGHTLFSSTNDGERTSLFSTSSSFAPPLPHDHSRSPQSPTSLPPARHGFAVPSSMRSTAGMQSQNMSSAASAQATSPMVQFTPIGGRRSGSYSNMNPTLNMQMQPPQNVQVMNVLDVPQGGNTIQEFALADTGFLEGIPGGMFDWGQWDSFFSRFASNGTTENGLGGLSAFSPARIQTGPIQLTSQTESLPPYAS